MQKYFSVLFMLLIFGTHLSFAQEKFEKESSISNREVPEKARQFIDAVPQKEKLKWYRETGLTTQSIEAKFKRNHANYSVEFDTQGNIADVEVIVNWEGLNENLKNAILLQLKNDCQNNKVIKVQKQYTGTEAELAILLISETETAVTAIKYELVVRCSNPGSIHLFEYLFNEEGALRSISKIIFKNSSHLEY